MPPILPISTGEFFQLLQKCIPPTGWPRTIAVANSGGSDSVCLMYLLNSVLTERKEQPGLPSELVALHINHKWQPSSDDMAKQAEESASKIGVLNLTSSISWGVPPMPPLPNLSGFELTARDVRMYKLFQGMLYTGAKCLAYGHHADDQVETAIMRLGMGSSPYGASGMDYVRRWGMGSQKPNGLGFFGLQGMERYRVRPLLDVTKDRILATCDAHGLTYVTDGSNFQPDITIRNHIRHIVSRLDGSEVTTNDPEPQSTADDEFINEEKAIIATINDLCIHPTREGLREAVKEMHERVQIDHDRVTEFLRRSLRTSPPSSLLFTIPDLQKITHYPTQTTLVRRILRCTSPNPWGSPRSEAHGSKSRLNELIERIWNPDVSGQRSFMVGSMVQWIPITIKQNGKVRIRVARDGETRGWLVKRAEQQKYRLDPSYVNPLVVDITAKLQRGLKKSDSAARVGNIVSILYDNRFRLNFNLSSIPPEIAASLEKGVGGTIVIEPTTKFFLPKVVWRRPGLDDTALGVCTFRSMRDNRFRAITDGYEVWDQLGQNWRFSCPWIRASFIRPWESI